MKLLFINEGILEPYKSSVKRGKSPYIYIYILTFEHTLTHMLRDSSIFWVKVNLEHLL